MYTHHPKESIFTKAIVICIVVELYKWFKPSV